MAVREPLLTDDRLHAYADRRLFPPEEAAAVERAAGGRSRGDGAGGGLAGPECRPARAVRSGRRGTFAAAASPPAVEGVAAPCPGARRVLRALGGMAAGLRAAGGGCGRRLDRPRPVVPPRPTSLTPSPRRDRGARRLRRGTAPRRSRSGRRKSICSAGSPPAWAATRRRRPCPPWSLGSNWRAAGCCRSATAIAAQYLYEDASGRRLTLYLHPQRRPGADRASAGSARGGEIGAFLLDRGRLRLRP